MRTLPPITGYLIASTEDSDSEVCIYGDAQGLRSLANLLLAVADLDQASLPDANLREGDSFHTHIGIDERVASEGLSLRIGRVEEKMSGRLRDCFPAPRCDLQQPTS